MSAQPEAEGAPTGAPTATSDEVRLVAALRQGEEAAFAWLLDEYHAALVRLAMLYVPSRAVAEEVAQETWLAVLQGLDRFEGRSSLKTWIFRILTNRAKTRGQREGRSLPFSALDDAAGEPDEPAVEPDRFLSDDSSRADHWVRFPQQWDDLPEERLLAQETLAHIQRVIDALPPSQRAVITLRDFETHLAACQGCRNYLAQMCLTLRALGQLTEAAIPVEGRDELLRTFRGWKRR